MPTQCLVARPGHGKSFVMSKIAAKNLRRGRLVFANFDIQGAVRFERDDLPHLPPSVVLLDEASSWFHSRNWQRHGDDMLTKWNQTRKAQWDLVVAVQDEHNLDAVIKRNCQYAWLLQACWSSVTRFDPRIKALARIKTEERREQFAEFVAQGVFPAGTRPPTVYPSEVTRPLYVAGRCWDGFYNFRSMQKGKRPVRRQRWWWDWDVASSYDTTETMREVQHEDSRASRGPTLVPSSAVG